MIEELLVALTVEERNMTADGVESVAQLKKEKVKVPVEGTAAINWLVGLG